MSAPNAGLPPHLKAAELSEDQKFINKFPGKKAPTNTDFLRKRLQKGVKYFDSGDYNMAKSTRGTGPKPLLGKAIPTPEGVTQRKHSTASKSKLVDGAEKSPSPNDEKVFFEKMEEKENNAEEEEKQ